MMHLAQAEQIPLIQMVEGMTARECGCCGRVERDEVAELLFVEALLLAAQARQRKHEQDQAAWAEAEAAIAEAQRAALNAAG
jgi:hypothetical protein